MSIFSSLLLVIALSLSGGASLHYDAGSSQIINLMKIDFSFVLYLTVIIGSTKLLAHGLSTYLLSASNSSCLSSRSSWNRNNSLRTYLECLVLYAIFSANVLKNTILSYKLDNIALVSMDILTQLTTSILVPFAYISLLVILLSSGINLLNHRPKGLVYKEISIITTSLVLLLSICIVIQNYFVTIN